MEVFREGESEEYNSEVDGEQFELETPGINYDILSIRDRDNRIHQPLYDQVMKHEELPEDFENMLTFKTRRLHHQRIADEKWKEENDFILDEEEKAERPVIDEADVTRDFLTSDQSFVFSDEMIIFDQKIHTSVLVIVDQRVYILFKDSLQNMYTPFDLEELAAVVMSPSNPMSAAFRLKDQNKFGRSHIIFQN